MTNSVVEMSEGPSAVEISEGQSAVEMSEDHSASARVAVNMAFVRTTLTVCI